MSDLADFNKRDSLLPNESRPINESQFYFSLLRLNNKIHYRSLEIEAEIPLIIQHAVDRATHRPPPPPSINNETLKCKSIPFEVAFFASVSCRRKYLRERRRPFINRDEQSRRNEVGKKRQEETKGGRV